MGAWGTAIFSDDFACDIRDDYVKEIILGKTSTEATETVKSIHLPTDPDDEELPVFWIALAITQWKKGRLLPEVRDEAISAIESGKDLLRWESEAKKVWVKRKNELNKAKQTLLSPMPPAKKIPMPSWMKDDPWQLGDLISYKITYKDITYPEYIGKYVILRIVETRSIQRDGPKRNFYSVYNWYGDEISDAQTVSSKFYLKLREGKDWYANRKYISIDKREIKEHDMRVLEGFDSFIIDDDFIRNGKWDGEYSNTFTFDNLLSRLLHAESLKK